jgi:hypothetical protein
MASSFGLMWGFTQRKHCVLGLRTGERLRQDFVAVALFQLLTRELFEKTTKITALPDAV